MRVFLWLTQLDIVAVLLCSRRRKTVLKFKIIPGDILMQLWVRLVVQHIGNLPAFMVIRSVGRGTSHGLYSIISNFSIMSRGYALKISTKLCLKMRRLGRC